MARFAALGVVWAGIGVTSLLRRNITRQAMFNGIEIGRERDSNEQEVGGWRVVASAWTLVLVFMLLLGGVS